MENRHINRYFFRRLRGHSAIHASSLSFKENSSKPYSFSASSRKEAKAWRGALDSVMLPQVDNVIICGRNLSSETADFIGWRGVWLGCGGGGGAGGWGFVVGVA